MYNLYSSPTLTHVTFSANVALYGGGLSNSHSSPMLTNATFSANIAELGSGGGMINHDNSSPMLTNVTFSGNSADVFGGGLFNAANSSPTLLNAILWGNTPDQVYNDAGSTAAVSYSDVQGDALYPGLGNINADPLLGILADNGGYTQTHALGAGSPAIDVGSPAACPASDQRGNIRPIDGDGNGTAVCDMGAYEFGYGVVLTVEGSGAVSIDPEKTDYRHGDKVTLSAAAAPGWTFTGWDGDASGADNPLTVTMNASKSITAHFTQDEYTLTVEIDPVGSGTVAVSPEQATYHYGDVVTLTPSANAGWTFTSWAGAAVTDNKLTISADTAVTAHFTQDEYTLTVEVDPAGSGSVTVVPLQATYHFGDVVTLTASANAGWTFSGWDGDAFGTDNPLTITMDASKSITAKFAQDQQNIYLPLILQ